MSAGCVTRYCIPHHCLEYLMKAEIVGGKLVITIDMNTSPEPSATGKTLSVASSKGNKPTSVKVNGETVIVGVNAYIYPPKTKAA